MLKCPFCGFDNEDGALFCEQCKSDLSDVAASAPVAEAVMEAAPVADMVEAAPMAEAVLDEAPIAAFVEEAPMALAEAVPPAVPVAAAPAPAPVSPAASAAAGIPAGATPKLRVIRGQKVNVEFPIYEGNNFIGRADDQPVDIDLEEQEPPEKIWCSRQHALLTFESGSLKLEDLNSSNGTFLNRARVHPGQPQDLKPNDVIQIGTVQLKVVV